MSVYKRCPISLAADGWSQCLCVLHSPCLTVQSRQSLCIRLVPMFVCVFYTVFVLTTQSRQSHCIRLVSVCVCVFYTVFVFTTQSRQSHCIRKRLLPACVCITQSLFLKRSPVSSTAHGWCQSVCFTQSLCFFTTQSRQSHCIRLVFYTVCVFTTHCCQPGRSARRKMAIKPMMLMETYTRKKSLSRTTAIIRHSRM